MLVSHHINCSLEKTNQNFLNLALIGALHFVVSHCPCFCLPWNQILFPNYDRKRTAELLQALPLVGFSKQSTQWLQQMSLIWAFYLFPWSKCYGWSQPGDKPTNTRNDAVGWPAALGIQPLIPTAKFSDQPCSLCIPFFCFYSIFWHSLSWPAALPSPEISSFMSKDIIPLVWRDSTFVNFFGDTDS